MSYKFNIGDEVRVDHATMGTWTGIVFRRATVGDEEEPEYEYWVSNAPTRITAIHPVLAWEHEITLINGVKDETT